MVPRLAADGNDRVKKSRRQLARGPAARAGPEPAAGPLTTAHPCGKLLTTRPTARKQSPQSALATE